MCSENFLNFTRYLYKEEDRLDGDFSQLEKKDSFLHDFTLKPR